MNLHVGEAPQAHNWTDDEIALVKKMLLDGASYAEIAAALGNVVSRNAVIGKSKRMKFAQGSKVPQFTRKAQGQPRQRANAANAKAGAILRRVEAKAAPITARPVFRPGKPMETIADPIVGIPFIEAPANPRACRWPLWGEETVGNCCGAKPVPGRPYCQQHELRSRIVR